MGTCESTCDCGSPLNGDSTSMKRRHRAYKMQTVTESGWHSGESDSESDVDGEDDRQPRTEHSPRKSNLMRCDTKSRWKESDLDDLEGDMKQEMDTLTRRAA